MEFSQGDDFNFSTLSDVEEQPFQNRVSLVVEAFCCSVDDVETSQYSDECRVFQIHSPTRPQFENPALDPYSLQILEAVKSGVLLDSHTFSSCLTDSQRLNYVLLLRYTGPASKDDLQGISLAPVCSVTCLYLMAVDFNKKRNQMKIQSAERQIFASFISYLINKKAPNPDCHRLSPKKTLKSLIITLDPKVGVDKCCKILNSLKKHCSLKQLNYLLSHTSGLKEELIAFLVSELPRETPRLCADLISNIESVRSSEFQRVTLLPSVPIGQFRLRTSTNFLHPQMEEARTGLLNKISV